LAIVRATYDIDSPQLGKTCKIDLAEGLDATHVDFIEEMWRPRLKRQYNLALLHFFGLREADRTDDKWTETLCTFGIQDQHWDWRQKSAAAASSNGSILSLLNGAEVEAAMVLQFGKTSRESGGLLPIVYVDFLAVAPWNRKQIQDPPRFKHLGTVMLGHAVATSISAGLDGRCGLHSLPQSVGFYRQFGMTDYGADAGYDSLTYFEISAENAKTFVEKR
jgi:hypothetical protein